MRQLSQCVAQSGASTTADKRHSFLIWWRRASERQQKVRQTRRRWQRSQSAIVSLLFVWLCPKWSVIFPVCMVISAEFQFQVKKKDPSALCAHCISAHQNVPFVLMGLITLMSYIRQPSSSSSWSWSSSLYSSSFVSLLIWRLALNWPTHPMCNDMRLFLFFSLSREQQQRCCVVSLVDSQFCGVFSVDECFVWVWEFGEVHLVM